MRAILSRALSGSLRRRKLLRCSFCGRDQDHVDRLVAGAGALICDACIHDCVSVLQDHGGFAMPNPRH